MITKIFNIPSAIISILSLVGMFFLATNLEKCSNKKELHRLDKIIAEYETNRVKDSTTIATQNISLFDLQQTIDATKGNDAKFQLIILEQKKEIKALKDAENTCCEELKHLQETDNIQYYAKDCWSKYYKRVFKKPDNIK